jgi:hypothetical protein
MNKHKVYEDKTIIILSPYKILKRSSKYVLTTEDIYEMIHRINKFIIKLKSLPKRKQCYFIYDYYDSADNDQNVQTLLMTIDYFVLDNGSAFRPFIGLNVGYANYESTFIEADDWIYGGQAGIVVDVVEMVNLDLSYRYSLSNADAFDHKGGVFFGLNYLF